MDKNTPFPECAKNCEVVKMLGVGECESVCGHKFDANGMQLTIPAVINQVCDCKNIKHCDYEIESNKCFSCGKQVKQTCL